MHVPDGFLSPQITLPAFGVAAPLWAWSARRPFGRAPVEQLALLLPYTKHIHGKFYGVDDSGIEPSIPYPEILALLEREGYAGTISAEWEGHAFSGEPMGFEQVAAWRAMCDRLLGGGPAPRV